MRKADRTAADTPSEPEFFERIVAGREATERGQVAQAERIFIDALEDARGQHAANETLALGSLITLYGRGGRLFEALVLARHLLARAECLGLDDDLAFAQGAVCNSLISLHLLEPLSSELAQLERLLPKISGNVQRELRKEFHSVSIGHAVKTDDAARARRHLDGYLALIAEDAQPQTLDLWVTGMHSADVALLEGNPQAALEHLERVASEGYGQSSRPLDSLSVAVPIYVAVGRIEDAAAGAAQGLVILERTQDEPHMCADRIRHGLWLATFYETHGQDLERARQVHDLVASAIVLRIAQLEAGLRNLPELGLSTDAAEELAGYRRGFLREQRTLLTHVAALFETSAELRQSLSRAVSEGFVALCAWCERVRSDGRTWLPIGHFVPRDGSPKLTHGICPACAEAQGF